MLSNPSGVLLTVRFVCITMSLVFFFLFSCDFLVRAQLASVFRERLSNAVGNHSCRHELRKVLEIFLARSI